MSATVLMHHCAMTRQRKRGRAQACVCLHVTALWTDVVHLVVDVQRAHGRHAHRLECLDSRAGSNAEHLW